MTTYLRSATAALLALFLVALTGWGQPEDRRRSSEAGFDHHLVKPADFARVHDLVARLDPPIDPAENPS